MIELISRAAPSVEAHHRSVRPDAGRNSGERQIIIKKVDTFPRDQYATWREHLYLGGEKNKYSPYPRYTATQSNRRRLQG